jgi:hypothetical protein
MSITIEYANNIATNLGSNMGIKGYMDYYSSTYASPSHAANMGFDGNPTGPVNLGGTAYNPVYFGTDVIGKYLHNTSASSNVDFLITGGDVNIEDGSGNASVIDYMFYTGGTAPSHTLSGKIDELVFGGSGFNSSSNQLNTELFSITGLSDVIGTGFVDTDSDGLYDGILGRLSTSPVNDVHKLVLDLMGGGTSGVGGPFGPGSTSVLEDVLDAYGSTQVGTAGTDIFDTFDAIDNFVLSGGNDTINSDFQVGASGDVIDLSGLNSFGSAADAALYANSNGGVISYQASVFDPLNVVTVTGVTSGFTADNFVV